ncbi:MAG: pyridoxamine 5'-phosphate oxidase family protein [Deltaproteobacteria bacterium]|nr:pyridoxamine 5'-phosphate oxidase family protein [Deltaproteobacteria bacterium]
MAITRLLIKTGVAVLVALLAIAGSNTGAYPGISQRDQQALSRADLVFIATVRKNGTQSRAAPVWFTTGANNDSILIQTEHTTWKAKRIARGSPVLVWIGNPGGPAFIGKAEITHDSTLQSKILADFRQKYLQNRLLGMGPSRGEFESGEQLAIMITPVRDLPDGFTSRPGSPPPQIGGPPNR